MCMQACIAGADRPGGWITRRSDTRHADAVRSWPEWRRASCRLCGWSRGRACLGRHGLSVCAHRRGTCGARRARPQDVGARRDPSERARSSAAMLTSARRRPGGLRGDALRSARRRRGKENAHNQELIIDRSYQMGCRPAGPSCERPGGRPGGTTVPQAAANRCNLAARGAGQSRARARLCASARVTQPGFVRRPRFCAALGFRPRLAPPASVLHRAPRVRNAGQGARNPESGTRNPGRSTPPAVCSTTRACVRAWPLLRVSHDSPPPPRRCTCPPRPPFPALQPPPAPSGFIGIVVMHLFCNCPMSGTRHYTLRGRLGTCPTLGASPSSSDSSFPVRSGDSPLLQLSLVW